jgi:hypothetical protein
MVIKMKLIIPASVDVKSMVSGLNLSDTLSKNLKHRIYYILSCIIVHDGNMEFYEDSDYYRTMCSENMKEILGPRYYRQAMNLLMNTDDPVIECNQSYQTGKYCKSYRLTDNYNTGEVKYRSLPEDLDLVNRIKENRPSYREGLAMMDKYDFLISQFDKHRLSVDLSAYEYIYNMYQKLKERVIKDNKYQMIIIHNLIGRWLNILDRLNDGDLNPLVSGKNHRLNSLFTQIPKSLRSWILCNGRPLVGIDVKACQPYLLASVMKDEFFTFGIEGYNLKSIYPSLFKELYDRNLVQGLWDTRNDWVVSSTGYTDNYDINITSNTCNNISYTSSTIKYSPFMWCHFFKPLEIMNIQEYQSIPFEQDYYSFVIKTNSDTEITPEELEKERSSFKKSTMYILFDDNQSRRKNNPKVKYMNQCYPGVTKWLELALEHIGGKELSYILQRSESYFLLNKVSRQFNQENPDAPIFTIHDGLYTHEEYVDQLRVLITDTGLELTGILPGVKIEHPRIELNPSIEDVDKLWKKVKWVTNQKQFDKKKRRVFQSNIDRALKFINTIN